MSGPEKVSAGRAIDKLEHIECKDTGFAYPGAAAPVLRGVRLTVSGQEKAVLVGESGCGKSTLAKLLFQYYPDYTGSILFNGQHPAKSSSRWWTSRPPGRRPPAPRQ